MVFWQWWQLVVYSILFVFIFPLYILILGCILKMRKQGKVFRSTFYTLLIQHSIADILSLFFYSIHRLAFILIPDSLFNHPVFPIASVYYNGLYWAIVIRSNGVALMTLHRFLSIVKPNLKITSYIQNAKPWKIWIFYWIPSLVFSFLAFSDSEIEFESPETMVLVMSSEIISKATRISFLYILFSCVFCIVSYGFIIRFIRKKSVSVSKSQRREIRLAVQVFLYFMAQLILLIYLSLLSITALDDNKEQITDIRKFYPLVYGTLSFIGPFTILIFNKDVSKRIRAMISAKNNNGQMESSTVPSGQEGATSGRIFHIVLR